MISIMILVWTLVFSLVQAIPLNVREVVNPKITSPSGGTVWKAGSKATVTWNVDDIPASLTAATGKLVLGYLSGDSEHLMLGGVLILFSTTDNPLADGFKYSDLKATFKVPSVTSRSDYIVVLFGDSGNASPKFSIKNSARLSVPGSLTSSGPSTETTVTAPIPITGTTVTGGTSTTAPIPISGTTVTGGTSTTTPTTQTTATTQTTQTTQTSQTSQTGQSTTAVPSSTASSASSIPSPSQTGATWKNSVSKLSCFGAAIFSLLVIL